MTLTQKYVETLAPWVGEAQAREWVRAWWEQEAARVGDAQFAELFRSFWEVFGETPEAYTHRWLEVDGARVLGGIRFFGGDTRRAYVEVVGWEGELELERLREVVRAEWGAFSPFAFRLLRPAGEVMPGARVDQFIFAGRVDAMKVAPTGTELVPVKPDEVGVAAEMAAAAYAAVAERDPELGAEMGAEDAESLEACRTAGTLDFVVTAAGERAGVFATRPDTEAFLRGTLVVEEAVRPEFWGRGLAAEAQGVWARRVREKDAETLLFGTIHRLNDASVRTAERAGRTGWLTYWFVNLA